MGRLVDAYRVDLEASTASQTSYAGEAEYLAAARAAFEKEEGRYSALRANASASVTLALTLLAGYIAFGDQYPPINQLRDDPTAREIGMAAAVVVAGLYLTVSIYHALRVLGANPRHLLGPQEFLPSAHLKENAARARRRLRPLGYPEWLAAQYTAATIENYVVDAAVAARMKVSRSALGASLVLLVVTTLFNTLTETDPSGGTVICVVDTPESAELCPEVE